MMSPETNAGKLEPDEVPLAWTAMPHRAPVLGVNGDLIGTVRSVVGDDATDIFHGIVLKRRADGRRVELLADRIESITTRGVQTNLTEDEAARLEPYEE